MTDTERADACAVTGCDAEWAADVPAVMAQGLIDAPDADLVRLCAVHAEQADAPQRPTN